MFYLFNKQINLIKLQYKKRKVLNIVNKWGFLLILLCCIT